MGSEKLNGRKVILRKSLKGYPVYKERDLDRDKNKNYIANDESIVDIIDKAGHETFIHPNHRRIGKVIPEK